MNKRLRAFWLAVVFALSIVVPVRQANAIVPLVGLAVSAFGPGGTLITADLLTAGVTALIGGSIVALAITPNSADAPMRVPLMSDQPTIDAAMPPPSAAASASPSQVTSYNCTYASGFTRTASSIDDACRQSYQAADEYSNQQSGGGTCPRVGRNSCSTYGGYNPATQTVHMSWTDYCTSETCIGGLTYGDVYSSGSGDFSVFVSTGSVVSTCASGYVLSGNTCVLQNARVAVPDNKYDVPVRSGTNGFSAPTSAQESDAQPSYASFSGGKVYAQGRNSSGQPVMIEYAVSADGTKTYITHYTQSEDATQTTVKTQAITVDTATGAVSGVTSGTAVGSVSPAIQAGAVPTVTTGAAVTSGTGTQSQSLVLPTDYARTGEAGAAATSINTKLDTLHKDLTEKGVDVTDPVAPQAAAFSDAFFNGTFGNLLAWRLPSHTSECPTITFDYMMFSSHQVHVMDAQCTISEQIRPVLNVVMIVVWSIVALFVLLEA